MLFEVLKWVVVTIVIAYAVELCFYRGGDEPSVQGKLNEMKKMSANQSSGNSIKRFRANFLDGWERGGAAFVVYHNGKKVVDLWGGHADKESKRLWKKDTLNVAFSSTKAVAAICVAQLVDQGRLAYDDLVTKFWPEFGRHGKANVTVRWLLGHRVSSEWRRIGLDIASDWRAIAKVFEEQIPNWPPGCEVGYHAITYGWLVDQVVRRTDPKKRSVGVFFKEEIAEKYNLDFHIGLPRCESYRVSRLTLPSGWNFLQEYLHKPSDFNILRFVHQMLTGGLLFKVGENVPWIAFVKDMTLNNPDLFEIEQAGVLGIGTARAMAELFERLRAGELLSEKTFKELTSDYILRKDVVTGAFVPRGQGLMIKSFRHENETFELLGHSGYGGQNVRIDLKNGLTFAYMSNGLKVGFGDTARTYIRLLHALYDVVIAK
ncbi:unnamed protein product [Heligmosomoides polygyrus]|uniref:Beta-lactamase domain-containing protein n=1 Tax=Heligmosomoides polygyrus TaxID=6339 RepID=A0A183F4S7_HELPZ|nr:unnamed protein product [Heligmosomoides polygyrus]